MESTGTLTGTCCQTFVSVFYTGKLFKGSLESHLALYMLLCEKAGGH
mgnify:CR=1 FL=1